MSTPPPRPLRVVTINVWTGLDYVGRLQFGEYERAERRAARFRALVHQLRELDADVVMVQEANPVRSYAQALGAALDMEVAWTVGNAGVRIGDWGVPVNLCEGQVTLARRGIGLRAIARWRLDRSWGLFLPGLSLHLREVNPAQVTAVTWGDTSVFLVNVHLAASAPFDFEVGDDLRRQLDAEQPGGAARAMRLWRERMEERRHQAGQLGRRVAELGRRGPVVIAGDFNAAPGSPAIAAFTEPCGARNVLAETALRAGGDPAGFVTWDPANPNVQHSAAPLDGRGQTWRGYYRIQVASEVLPQWFDHIYVSEAFDLDRSPGARIVLDQPHEGLHPSDHYGVLAELCGSDEHGRSGHARGGRAVSTESR